MKIILFILSCLVFAESSPVTKVPSGKTVPPTTLPCVENGVKGEEKCVVQPLPTANAETKLVLPEPSHAKKERETPRKKKN